MSCEECGLAYETGVSDGESTPKTLSDLRKALAEHGMVAVSKELFDEMLECLDPYHYEYINERFISEQAAREEN